ncbi:hypothetical protein [Rhodovulum visakhapatnamense]|uniref:Heme peroxidase n=1 Tax=Rhodovulum visakhapatnamense TaxID=364297 RepID=A0A4V3GTW7_9RHOB|nr:hypothetical protein [Rhodovulum visakhapatnamense]TDX28520.1 hypothetical protein EV657_11137 [Rhodovulum visakhapatnamense]
MLPLQSQECPATRARPAPDEAGTACLRSATIDAFSYPVWPEAPHGPFGYLFPDAAEARGGVAAAAALRDLASAMAGRGTGGGDDSGMPAIYTYLGQVIARELAAGTDPEGGLSGLDLDRVDPLPRRRAMADLRNDRSGRLSLESLYGAEAGGWRRDPAAPARLWSGVTGPSGSMGEGVRIDPARRNRLPKPALAEQDKAYIGAPQTDAGLATAEVHLVLARFHNAVVARAPGIGGPPAEAGDAAFDFARDEVRKHFQWLVVNDYLRRICLPEVLDAVMAEEAPVYRDLLQRCPGLPEGRLPLPFEFQAAAIRLGETMARPSYDWSARHGFGCGAASVAGPPGWRRAPGRMDFSRLTDESGTRPDRHARGINTRITPDLLCLHDEPPGLHGRMRQLAERTLRRGLRLNLASGQDCLRGMARLGVRIAPLSAAELAEGPGGGVLARAGMIEATPLWYYILREAEARTGGRRLGPLGSRIVAETLVGLCVCDPDSYWHHLGSDHGRWHPRDGVRPAGEPVTTVAALIRAAGMRA